jgi:hypothetical protein
MLLAPWTTTRDDGKVRRVGRNIVCMVIEGPSYSCVDGGAEMGPAYDRLPRQVLFDFCSQPGAYGDLSYAAALIDLE